MGLGGHCVKQDAPADSQSLVLMSLLSPEGLPPMWGPNQEEMVSNLEAKCDPSVLDGSCLGRMTE